MIRTIDIGEAIGVLITLSCLAFFMIVATFIIAGVFIYKDEQQMKFQSQMYTERME